MLTVSAASKSYGPVAALSGVSADFKPGEIHAVLGENGAGKSTLMGILAGFVVPDSGTVEMNGVQLPVGRPFECKRLGIEMIHQHFTLVPAFTVQENLALARIGALEQPLDLAGLTEGALALAQRLGWVVVPKALAGTLGVGAQQRVEILKALSGDASVLIFDEPTAVLSQDEVDDLFRVLRELKAAGKTIILIAHKLSEVLAIADRVTVLRRGKWVASAPREAVDARQLAEWMVGEMPNPLQSASSNPGGVVVRAQGLSVLGDRREQAIRGVDFEIRRGEILGFGGVDGNGQVELAEALAKVRNPSAGALSLPETVAYIPQDRHQDGLALGLSIADNLLIAGHRRPELLRGPFLIPRAISRWVLELIDRFSIRVGSPADPVSSLSGGNQQKVVVSRSLDQTPELLVAVNPTRGLDIRATDFVQSQILKARDAGAAVALVSTDLDELAALATRQVFLSRGRLVESEGAAAVVGGTD